MKSFLPKILTLSAGALLLSGSFAVAADMQGTATMDNSMGMASAAQGFDWNRVYLGIYGGGYSATGSSGAMLGGVVGANYTLGSNAVIGAEIMADGYSSSSSWYPEAYAVGRLGVVASDQAMIYGLAGAGSDDGSGAYIFGGGVEFAVSDSMTVRGQALGGAYWGDSPDWGGATVGVSWYLP